MLRGEGGPHASGLKGGGGGQRRVNPSFKNDMFLRDIKRLPLWSDGNVFAHK